MTIRHIILKISPKFLESKSIHFKQGLILLVFSIGIDIIFSVIETPPSFSYLLVESSFYLTVFALLIKGITNAQNGKMRKLPIIGELASYLKF